MALLPSKPAHCLHDLLSRWRLGELPGRPVCIISNHPDHAAEAEHNGLPYHHLPVTPETRSEQEERMVLARAVQAHLQHRVLVVDNRAIVFG